MIIRKRTIIAMIITMTLTMEKCKSEKFRNRPTKVEPKPTLATWEAKATMARVNLP